MQTPLSVISQRHMPIVRLQQQTIMPFIIMQQLHMPPCSMVQRFCIMLHAILSSHEQVIFIPPWHFSNFIVQRGTIIMLAGIVVVPPIMGVLMLVAPMPAIEDRSIIILVMSFTPLLVNRTLQSATAAIAGILFRNNSGQGNDSEAT